MLTLCRTRGLSTSIQTKEEKRQHILNMFSPLTASRPSLPPSEGGEQGVKISVAAVGTAPWSGQSFYFIVTQSMHVVV